MRVALSLFLDNSAVEEVHRALSVARKPIVVRYHADSCPFSMQLGEQLHHPFTIL